jgi:Fic family protein
MNERNLRKVLPVDRIGILKDMAMEVIRCSARLEGALAPETAKGLSRELRLLNSYHSNLIEGHKTFISDIKRALRKEWASDDQKRYAQELCSAHAVVEEEMMDKVYQMDGHVCNTDFIQWLHHRFYMQLPEAHRFTHQGDDFTDIPVNPGHWREMEVSVRSGEQLGPEGREVPHLMSLFAQLYNPEAFHGDERMLVIAAGHHRLAWLHPFRDGNGRVIRLFTGACLASIGVNVHGLWSLSRGLSRNKNEYMVYLWAADSFEDDHYADFIEWLLETCLDQISFMEKLLDMERIERRIEKYVQHLFRFGERGIRPESEIILREAFRSGAVPRGRVPEMLRLSDRQARRIVSPLIERGMLVSNSQKQPLRFGFPEDAMPEYFPKLFIPEIMGE